MLNFVTLTVLFIAVIALPDFSADADKSPSVEKNVGDAGGIGDDNEDHIINDDDDDIDSRFESEVEDVDDVIDKEIPETTAEEEKEKDVVQETQKAKDKELEKLTHQVETSMLFPHLASKELVAGKPIHLITCLRNKGNSNVTVESIEASFRYPQDYSYFIQNFTTAEYNLLVEAKLEASFQYIFHPHESYGGRPFGLTIVMWYRDIDLNQYAISVFNETITIKEYDVFFDAETFFLYVLLSALAVLAMFGLNYAMHQHKVKKVLPMVTVVETGTHNRRSDIDYDWLPKETTTEFQAPKPPRSKSTKHRRVERNNGRLA